MKFTKPPSSEDESVIIMANEKPDFMALGADASLFTQYADQLDWLPLKFKETKVIDYTDDGIIASKRYPGDNELYQYYKLFSWQYVLSTIMVITILSIIVNRHRLNVKKYLETYLDIAGLILSKSLPSSIKDCDNISRMILGPVILLLLFTSMQFSNHVLDSKVKKIPDKVIDSWEDLAMRKEVGIVAIHNDFVTEFVKQVG